MEKEEKKMEKTVVYNLKPAMLSYFRENGSLSSVRYVLLDKNISLKREHYQEASLNEKEILVYLETGEEKIVSIKNLWNIDFENIKREELRVKYPTLTFFLNFIKENLKRNLARKEEELSKSLNEDVQINIDLKISI